VVKVEYLVPKKEEYVYKTFWIDWKNCDGVVRSLLQVLPNQCRKHNGWLFWQILQVHSYYFFSILLLLKAFGKKKILLFFLQLIHHTEFVMCYLQVLHNVWEDFVRLHYPNSDHISKHRDKQNFWKNKEKEEEECKICE